MLNKLLLLPPDAPTAVLLRHADRDRIPHGEIGNDVPLNEKGIQNAIGFGRALKPQRIARILTSPVWRCEQTAAYIREGYESDIDIVSSVALGAPGLHITDAEAAGSFFLEHGFQHWYMRYVKNEPLPGVTPPDLLRERTDAFLQQETQENGITLFITHDSLIAFYAFAQSGHIYPFREWIRYLDGIIRPMV